jgi:large subunit ribosomal protein L10
MPSEKILQSKQQFVEELAEKLKNSACGVLADYKGISVVDDTVLRKSLREAGVEYFVVKNTLLKRAAEKAGIEGLDPYLSGATALALSKEDIVLAPKLLYKQEENSKGAFSIKAGFVDGKVEDKNTMVAYAKLPSKADLVAKLLFVLQSPIQKLAIAASEIAKKKESEVA